MKDKIKRDLEIFYEIREKDNVELKNKILKLLTFKYNTIIQNKRIMQANNEFLTMSRVLLKEMFLPIEKVSGIVKI